jgi:hypothetical protein
VRKGHVHFVTVYAGVADEEEKSNEYNSSSDELELDTQTVLMYP